MKPTPGFEFPPERQRALDAARWLEWITIVYLITVIVLLYFVLGSSQAMKTAWIDDILSLTPPLVFLIASRVAVWKPDHNFPYGYHRAISVAFLSASLALFAAGAWLLVDAVIKLAKFEHPTIGGITLFGYTIWLGWLMIAALLYSAMPAVLLGRVKLPVAAKLHDKVLYVDAKMNKADWMAESAAIVGILGIGLGYWWADAVAAAIISLEILHDGYSNLKQVIGDLMNRAPRSVDGAKSDPLPERIRMRLEEFPWVREAKVRLREEGHVFFGEAFVVVADGAEDLAGKLEEAARACTNLDWRMHDLVLTPVTSLDQSDGERPAQ